MTKTWSIRDWLKDTIRIGATVDDYTPQEIESVNCYVRNWTENLRQKRVIRGFKICFWLFLAVMMIQSALILLLLMRG